MAFVAAAKDGQGFCVSRGAKGDSYQIGCTILTARLRSSSENLFDFFMAQSSQRVEPPQKLGGPLRL